MWHSVCFPSCASQFKRVFVEILFVVCHPGVFVETLLVVHSSLTTYQHRSTAHFTTTGGGRTERGVAASSHNNITIDNDICQYTIPVTTDQIQTRIASSISHIRQLLGSLQHSTTDFVPLPVRTNEHDHKCLGQKSTPSARTNAFNRWNIWV